MNLNTITPVVLTCDEEINLPRTLAALSWATRIVVCDSFSKDQTPFIARSHPKVHFFQRAFDTHSCQWNAAVERVETEWVLSLDADYLVTERLIKEIHQLENHDEVNGFRIPFRFAVEGVILNAHLLPPRCALFRKARSRYIQDGHTQLLVVEGVTAELTQPLIHDDRKPFRRWWSAQGKYARLEADKLTQTPWSVLSLQDRVRALAVIAPLAVLFFCLVIKRLALEGKAGWIYSAGRVLAEARLSWELLHRRFSSSSQERNHQT
ncbi:MAG: glycosyltransferase family 2 protein [Candidatus Methylacidiphilales bacterium]